jgi:predicted O-methyltransferase YrrM
LIDPWDSDRYDDGKLKGVLERFRREIASGIVNINRGTSVEELKKFPDGHFDWIYIDTTHSYETTVEELETGRNKVKAGGIIAGHDYTVGNINKQLRYGVIRAVHEFCNEHNWKMVFLTHESNRYLSYALTETLPAHGRSP